MRRLLALAVLLGLIGAGVWLWRAGPDVSASSLGQAGHSLRSELASVGADFKAAKLKVAVSTALGLNRTLKPWSLGTEASDQGVVVLRGVVNSDALRQAAERVAAAVPGVTSVRNEIRVEPLLSAPVEGRSLRESVDDGALEVRVRLAFSLNRELQGSDLKVRAFRHDLVVSGEVDRPEQRSLAVAIAAETPGAGGVADEITSRGPAAAASLRDRARVAQQSLHANANLAGYALQVAEDSGRLVLHGSVRTGAEKDLAGLLAAQAAGVSVENRLAVSL